MPLAGGRGESKKDEKDGPPLWEFIGMALMSTFLIHASAILLTMKFCCSGAQLYMVGIGLTALMILIGMDWILPSLSLASALRMN